MNAMFILILMLPWTGSGGFLLYQSVADRTKTGADPKPCATAGNQLCIAPVGCFNGILLSSEGRSLGAAGGGHDRICGDAQDPHLSFWAAKDDGSRS